MRHAMASLNAPTALCGARLAHIEHAELVSDTVLELIHCTECYERAKGLGVLPYSEWLDELRSQESYHARGY